MLFQERYSAQNLAICDRILDFLVQLNRHLLVLLLIPAAIIWFWPPYQQKEAAEKELARLTKERDRVQAQVNQMNRKLDYLKNHPEYLETVARDRLRLQKKGELIMRFPKRFEN